MPAHELNNPLKMLIGYQLRRASAAAMETLADDLARLDLRPSEASILLLVDGNALAKPIDIARELGIQRANMTPLIAGLERRGLIARAAADGRSHALSLTEGGRQAAKSAFEAMQTHEERLRLRLGRSAAQDLADRLARLWDE